MVRPHAVIDSWKTIRRDSIQALLDMPAGSLAFQPTPDLMPFADIARHILIAGHGLAGLLLDGVDNLAVPEFRQMIGKYAPEIPTDAGADVIAAKMGEVMEADAAALSAQPESFFGGMMTRFDGLQVTRLEMLQFVKEHELTHRSQMFMYLRLKGVVPPTTRRKLAKK
ncbi:MAG: DinB family protein [Acidobacteria bacterium]|nr:DinB family protein [Acidobacteriota bacterium]